MNHLHSVTTTQASSSTPNHTNYSPTTSHATTTATSNHMDLFQLSHTTQSMPNLSVTEFHTRSSSANGHEPTNKRRRRNSNQGNSPSKSPSNQPFNNQSHVATTATKATSKWASKTLTDSQRLAKAALKTRNAAEAAAGKPLPSLAPKKSRYRKIAARKSQHTHQTGVFNTFVLNKDPDCSEYMPYDDVSYPRLQTEKREKQAFAELESMWMVGFLHHNKKTKDKDVSQELQVRPHKPRARRRERSKRGDLIVPRPSQTLPRSSLCSHLCAEINICCSHCPPLFSDAAQKRPLFTPLTPLLTHTCSSLQPFLRLPGSTVLPQVEKDLSKIIEVQLVRKKEEFSPRIPDPQAMFDPTAQDHSMKMSDKERMRLDQVSAKHKERVALYDWRVDRRASFSE